MFNTFLDFTFPMDCDFDVISL